MFFNNILEKYPKGPSQYHTARTPWGPGIGYVGYVCLIVIKMYTCFQNHTRAGFSKVQDSLRDARLQALVESTVPVELAWQVLGGMSTCQVRAYSNNPTSVINLYSRGQRLAVRKHIKKSST